MLVKPWAATTFTCHSSATIYSGTLRFSRRHDESLGSGLLDAGQKPRALALVLVVHTLHQRLHLLIPQRFGRLVEDDKRHVRLIRLPGDGLGLRIPGLLGSGWAGAPWVAEASHGAGCGSSERRGPGGGLPVGARSNGGAALSGDLAFGAGAHDRRRRGGDELRAALD